MVEQIAAKCLMCGKTYQLTEEHKDFKKLSEKPGTVPSFICDLCSHRIRYEADEKNREKKPM